jgi:hypothetical protein
MFYVQAKKGIRTAFRIALRECNSPKNRLPLVILMLDLLPTPSTFSLLTLKFGSDKVNKNIG